MGYEKSIVSGKEHRKPYRSAKAVDSTCRNHGSCSYCLRNRMHSTQKRIEIMRQKIVEITFAEADGSNIEA